MTGLSWQSLRTRLVAGSLAFLSRRSDRDVRDRQHLRADMESAISAQQYSTVSLIASEIHRSVNERSAILDRLARHWAATATCAAPAPRHCSSPRPARPAVQLGVVVECDGPAPGQHTVLPRPHRHRLRRPAFRLRCGRRQGRHQPATRRQRTGVRSSPTRPADPGAGRAPPGSVGRHQPQAKPNFLDQISTASTATGDFLSPTPDHAPSSPRPTSAGDADRPHQGQSGTTIISAGTKARVSRSARGGRGTVVVGQDRQHRLADAVGPAHPGSLPGRPADAQRLTSRRWRRTLLASLIAGWWVRRQLQPLERSAVLLDEMRQARVRASPSRSGGTTDRQSWPTPSTGCSSPSSTRKPCFAKGRHRAGAQDPRPHPRHGLSVLPAPEWYRRLPFASDAVRDIYRSALTWWNRRHQHPGAPRPRRPGTLLQLAPPVGHQHGTLARGLPYSPP